MIQIKNLKFSNALPYGDNNEVCFDSRVAILTGDNGAGKSSIPTLLEELFYNKNSRGIAKGDISNRFTDKKGYTISSDFSVDEDQYNITKTVTSSAKVKLTKNGEDISGHTATQTYKIVEKVLGLDFPTFTKLVYQSMVSSLDFLQATDANRKKFLVNLLGLEEYSEKEKIIKDTLKETKQDLAHINGKISQITTFISANSDIPELQTEIEVPDFDESLEESVAEQKAALAGAESANKIAAQNRQAQNRLQLLQDQSVDEPTEEYDEDLVAKYSKIASDKKAEFSVAKSNRTQLENTVRNSKCSACGTVLKDTSAIPAQISSINTEMHQIKAAYDEANKIVAEANATKEQWNKYNSWKSALEVARQNYNPDLPTQDTDIAGLKQEMLATQSTITELRKRIDHARQHNLNVDKNNAKANLIMEQLESFRADLQTQENAISEVKDKVHRQEVLAEAFGSKGLIAYKIESTIKVFESLINQYLVRLSDGQFSINFVVESSKLALKICDSGCEVSIKSLSTGELNKVNTSTLLAIRKTLTSISKININLLFLDEVVAVLTDTNKDVLVELLLEEHGLNSILVSHGYSHPLADKWKVVKDDKISRLKNG